MKTYETPMALELGNAETLTLCCPCGWFFDGCGRRFSFDNEV